MQSFNLCNNFFAKNFLLSLSIFPLIFIFFLVFEVFFGNAHFIYAQISIIEIKPIEKKIVNVEQNLAKTENKNTSLVYEINPIVNDFSQIIIDSCSCIPSENKTQVCIIYKQILSYFINT